MQEEYTTDETGLKAMTSGARDAVNRVKIAEAKADEVARKAQDEAQRTILDAKLNAKEIAGRLEAEAHAEAHSILARARAEIERRIETITRNTRKEKEELEDRAKVKLDEAADFIVEEFLKFYGGGKA